LEEVRPLTLNIAGPRATEDSKIYAETRDILLVALGQIDPNILCQIRESVLSQCGRWDQIRWQVPSWFSALGVIALGFATRSGTSTVLPSQIFFILFVFGLLCSLLLINLIRYEIKVTNEFNAQIEQQHLDAALKATLRIKRPFNFVGIGILGTATLWFLIYTLLLTLFLFIGFLKLTAW
jgi:hypothetical protein